MLIADLRAFAAQRSRHQWIALFFAIAMPAAILGVFALDARTTVVPGEQLIYVESWSANRSDEQIKADQQRRQREREREQAERQREWRALAERLGIEP